MRETVYALYCVLLYQMCVTVNYVRDKEGKEKEKKKKKERKTKKKEHLKRKRRNSKEETDK